MAIALVQSASLYDGSTDSLAFPGNVTSGNLLIVAVKHNDAAGGPPNPPSKASGTATIGSFTRASGTGNTDQNSGAAIYYALVTGTGSLTVEFTDGGGKPGDPAMFIAEYSGAHASAPFDTSGRTNFGDVTTMTTDSFTVAEADSLVVVLYANNFQLTGTQSAGTNYVHRHAEEFGVAGYEDRVAAPSGSQTASFVVTDSTGTGNATLVWAVFKPAAGGGGTQTIDAGTVASAAVVNAPKLNLSIAPETVASAAVVRAATLNLSIAPGTVASAAVVRNAALNFVVYPGTIASAAVVRNATLNLVIYPGTVASAASVPNPVVALGDTQTIEVGTVSSSASVASPTVSPGAVTVSAGTVASAATLYAPTLNIVVYPGTTASVAVVNAPSLSFVIYPGTVSSSRVVPSPALGFAVYPGTVASSASVPSTTLTTGAVTILVGSFTSPSSVPDLALFGGASQVHLPIFAIEMEVHPVFTLRQPSVLEVHDTHTEILSRVPGVAP